MRFLLLRPPFCGRHPDRAALAREAKRLPVLWLAALATLTLDRCKD